MPVVERALAYQPVVQLRTGRTAAVETLLRVTVDGVPVPPPDYIAGLDDDERIELGRWVRGQAFADLASLRADPGVPEQAAGVRQKLRRSGRPAGVQVAVNVDARELVDPSWTDDLLKQVAAADLVPADLTLELTEAASFADPGRIEVLRRVAYAGVQIALDDAGTGYNALALLEQLPVTALKIDRGFVSRLGPGSTSTAIVRALTTIAHELGLRVTAEGIETPAELAALVGMEVDYGQGYLLGRPMPFPALSRFMADALGERSAYESIRVLHFAGASPDTIAAALNKEGLRTEEGLRWKRETVLRAMSLMDDLRR